ncbi:Rgg family transcriptional regulator [Vagococcus acidifermentans]|uniref:HTH cro/C1-type domain-containing protein n=1 Tax=Vagococcus acidifermentans TaxID=564710 RepID=A0A430AP28_9ENTE|nr:helix-turn-helix domain-containing protein [Vagococcus acidifermentans]RSU09637.1 hypothetical protein CBF27_12165 [Vagococcus acidifermentans]
MKEKNFGPLFADFRKRKGYTAKDTAKNIISVQFLRLFEKGDSDINLTNFYDLLDRINVTFEEFMFEYEENSVDKDISQAEQILDAFMNERNSIKFKKFAASLNESYQKKGNIRDYHFYLVTEAIYDNIFLTDTQTNIEELEKYLFDCETWGKYEAFIAANIYFHFSSDSLVVFAERALPTQLTSDSTAIYSIDFYLHACLSLISRNELASAEYLLKKFNDRFAAIGKPQYLILTIFELFLQGLLKIQKGDPSGKETCEDIIEFFESTLKQTDYANALHHLFNLIYGKSPLGKNRRNRMK